ncbi:PPC domain-containing DNA-binding protein [Streptomyces daliensis]
MPQDVDLYIPFPSLLSAEFERVTANQLIWPRKHRLTPSREAEERHLALTLAERGARFHPHATGPDLDLGCDQQHWLFLFDDIFEGRWGQDAEHAAHVVRQHDGEDFMTGLTAFCAEREVRSGSLSFIGGFRNARLVGSCTPLKNPEAPLWDDVSVDYLEVFGGGTLAWDTEENVLAPHIHVAAGIKGASAEGRVSHLLEATVQFICEITVVEFTGDGGEPPLTRRRAPELYNVPLLSFATS